MTTSCEAEDAWTQRCYDSAKGLLVDKMRDSSFFRSTNPTSERGHFLLYVGGVPESRRIFPDIAVRGYQGFELK